MDLKIKKKERKKCLSGLTLSGLACLPPPAPPLPFHLGLGPVLSPTSPAHYPSPALGWPRAKTKFQLLLGYIDVEAVIFDKTFSDGLLPSHNNSIYRHKFATVSQLPRITFYDDPWYLYVTKEKESSYIVLTVLIL